MKIKVRATRYTVEHANGETSVLTYVEKNLQNIKKIIDSYAEDGDPIKIIGAKQYVLTYEIDVNVILDSGNLINEKEV